MHVHGQPEPLSRNESGRFGALKSDSTHHFFRNVCTKSGSLRFSQFSGWLVQIKIQFMIIAKNYLFSFSNHAKAISSSFFLGRLEYQ
jgi:hypothetical protein